MSIFKMGSNWYVYITFPDGTRYRKKAGTKRQAQQREHQIKAQALQGKWDIFLMEDVRFNILVEKYLRDAEVSKSRSTFVADRSRIDKHLIPVFGKMMVRRITTQKVDEYKAKRVHEGAAPKTVNNELGVLSHMLKKAQDWNLVDKNVVARVEKMKVVINPPRFLSQSEIQRLIEAAEGSHIYALILTGLHTGMRKSELLNMKWSDIDFENQTISVTSKDDWHTKNYKARTLQLTPVLYQALKDHELEPGSNEYVFTFRGKAIRQDIRKSWRRVINKAGLHGVTLHTLRRTFASQLVMAGVSLRDVQDLMGHQSFQTTLRYAHLSPDHVKRQVLNLPFAEVSDKRAP